MKKLFEDLKRCKYMRNRYVVKPTIKIHIDTRNYYFSFLPTVLYLPWVYRHPNFDDVIDIWWLHFHILIGTWEEKKDDD